ncbi:acyltransferase family protein [Paenibacillus rigui]|uniref:Acyltransferase 3 domain-containing protein n=1 Tax=Paenibacillus rigui TaxID=554312 RepID=A0A229ULE3_9BACL|nr:acyltransferase [Paenibacillus rigui]OXM83729.1 hypothetical protein CF651_24365 [Paenibacillus rigui]
METNRLTVPLIQAARGIAVVLVMLFHTSQLAHKYFEINFLGVSGMDRSGGYSYFFVLTGFLMFTLYGRHFGNPKIWSSFILKRFIRIYPLYWLVNAAVIPIYFLVPSFGLGFETKPSEIVRSLLLIPESHVPILGVAWSLIFVVFFYFMFSLLFVLNKKTAAVLFSIWIVLICLSGLGWIHVKDHVLLNFLLDGQHLEFMLGMAIAYAVRFIPARTGGYWLGAGILLFPVVWMIRYAEPAFAYPNVLYTIGSALVLVGIGTLRVQAPAWLKPVQFLGDASYSILLTSLGFLSIMLKLAKTVHLSAAVGPYTTTALCFVCALGMCCVFYERVEKPLVVRLKSMLVPKAAASGTATAGH